MGVDDGAPTHRIGDIGGRRYRPQTLDPEPNSWEISLGYTVRPDRWGEVITTSAVALLIPALHHPADTDPDAIRRPLLVLRGGVDVTRHH